MPDFFPIEWTDDDLDRISDPEDPEAQQEARMTWEELAHRSYRDLLDAHPSSDVPGPTRPDTNSR